jgi:hypothetical protein
MQSDTVRMFQVKKLQEQNPYACHQLTVLTFIINSKSQNNALISPPPLIFLKESSWMLLHNDSLITTTLSFMFVVDDCNVCVCTHMKNEIKMK